MANTQYDTIQYNQLPKQKEKLKIVFYLIPDDENLGVQYIASALINHGYKPDIFIEKFDSNSLEKIVDLKPHIICFSTTTGINIEYLKKAQYLKEKFNYLSVFGGAHTTYFPEFIYNQGVDIISIGEAEESFIKLLNSLMAGGDFLKTKGFWIKYNNEIFKNDVDVLPDLKLSPNREIVYQKYEILKNNPTKPFIISRGCPYRCSFCFNPIKNGMFREPRKLVRHKPVADVIEEITSVIKKYPLKAIRFEDSTFSLNHKYLHELLPLFHRAFPEIKYLINDRFDTLNEEIIKLLKATGCDRVSLGVETGNENLRNNILKKQINNAQIIEISRLLHKYNIRIVANTIYGLPDETYANALESVKVNRYVRAEYTFASIFQPYPKTDLYEYCKLKKLIPDNFDFNKIPVNFHFDSPLKINNKNIFINFHHLHYYFVVLHVPDFLIKFLVQLKANYFYYALNLLPLLLRSIKYKDAPFKELIIKYINDIKEYKLYLKNSQTDSD